MPPTHFLRIHMVPPPLFGVPPYFILTTVSNISVPCTPAHGESEEAAEQVEAPATPPGYDDPPAGVAVPIFCVVELEMNSKFKSQTFL